MEAPSLSIELAVHGSVAVVALDRPRKLNALDGAAARELDAVLGDVAERDDVRAVVFTGHGRGFCAGVDLTCLDDVGEGRQWATLGDLVESRFNPIVRRLASMPKPTLCYVNGVAAGAGASLSLACDFRMGAPTCSFVQAFSALALLPDSGGTFFLPRLVGLTKALELALLAAPINADQALALGLLNWKAAAEGMDEPMRVAEKLARLPRRAVLETRRRFHASFQSTLEEALQGERQGMTALGAGADHREGLTAIREKRAPNFKD